MSEHSLEIPFRVTFGDHSVGCDQSADTALSDLRFLAHNFRLIGENSKEIEIDLQPDNIWQSGDVVLLDFENGEGACANGSPQTNVSVRGVYSGHAVRGIQFDIGVHRQESFV